MIETEDRLPAGVGRSAALWLIAIGWLLITGGLVVASIGASLTFFGEPVRPEDAARSQRLIDVSALTAVVLPVVGLVVAARGRRRVAGVVFAVLLLIGGVWAGLISLSAYRERPVPPAPQSTVCQEHSGGDTDCPGG